MNRSPHTQERAQPVEYEFRSLLDDPVAHTIDRFELEVAEQIGVTAQQRRSDHWVIHPVQPADWDVHPGLGILAPEPTPHLACLERA